MNRRLENLLIGSGIGLGKVSTDRKEGESEEAYQLRMKRNEQSRRAKAKARAGEEAPEEKKEDAPKVGAPRKDERKPGESDDAFALRMKRNEQSRRAKAKARGTLVEEEKEEEEEDTDEEQEAALRRGFELRRALRALNAAAKAGVRPYVPPPPPAWSPYGRTTRDLITHLTTKEGWSFVSEPVFYAADTGSDYPKRFPEGLRQYILVLPDGETGWTIHASEYESTRRKLESSPVAHRKVRRNEEGKWVEEVGADHGHGFFPNRFKYLYWEPKDRPMNRAIGTMEEWIASEKERGGIDWTSLEATDASVRAEYDREDAERKAKGFSPLYRPEEQERALRKRQGYKPKERYGLYTPSYISFDVEDPRLMESIRRRWEANREEAYRKAIADVRDIEFIRA